MLQEEIIELLEKGEAEALRSKALAFLALAARDELYQEDDTHWILDTTVHGLGPLRWYYLMLADKIEILDSPAAEALKEEVRRFVEKWLA